MDIVYTYIVDFARPQRTNELLLMQYDNLTRIPRFILMNDGSPLDVSEVDMVTINAVLPDETRLTAEAALSLNADGEKVNEIIYKIPAAMTAAIGKTVMTISLYKAAVEPDDDSEKEEQKLLNSFEFYVNTRNELNKDDGDEEDQYAGLRDLLEKAAESIEKVEQMARQTALPNPYPIRIILEGSTYNYNGSSMVTVDLGTMLTRLQAIEQAFPDGCSRIAAAITDNGVATSSNAGVSTIIENIGQIRPLGRQDVVDSPHDYELYTLDDITAARLTGQQAVTSNPNAYGLYTQEQYQKYGSDQYDAGFAAGAAGVSASGRILISGSMDTRYETSDTSQWASNCSVYVNVKATAAGLQVTGTSGQITTTAYHWSSDHYETGNSSSYRPSARIS